MARTPIADSGATWTDQTEGTGASGVQWAGVASDATGTHLVAVGQQDLWTSADSGATWTNRMTLPATSSAWIAVASDASGAHLIAATGPGNGDIWTSADSGVTWTDVVAGTDASGQGWVAVASDASGAHLVAASDDPPLAGYCCEGDIWTN